MAKQKVLIHVRRYNDGTAYSLTQNEIEAGITFEECLSDDNEDQPYAQAAYEFEIDEAPSAALQPIETSSEAAA